MRRSVQAECVWWILSITTTVLIVAGVAAAVFAIDRRRMNLTEVSDDDFLLRYGEQFGQTSDRVLAERRYLSTTLHIPYSKLAPEQTWDQLAKHGPLIAFSVGADDVREDLLAMFKKAGLAPPDPFPTTVGGTIVALLRIPQTGTMS